MEAGLLFNKKKIKESKRSKTFFSKSSEYVAKSILGDYLVLKTKECTFIGRIVETESYLGGDDDASHSFGAKITLRNKILYEQGGRIYVYLIYGMHWCFNIVVSVKKSPQAVFIRALQPLEGIEVMKRKKGIKDINKLTNGPCRWTKSFGIDKAFLGKSITSDEIFIVKGPKNFSIVKAKRIGIDYATDSRDKLLRFYIKSNPFVSRK